MQYNYNFQGAPDENLLAMFIGIYAIAILFGFIFGIAFYVMRSVGVHTVAKRRGLNMPWLAWLPIGFEWIIGSISDQYQYVVKGEVKNKRKLMLGLSIASVLIQVITSVLAIVMAVRLIMSAGTATDSEMASMVMMPLLSVVGFSTVLSVVAIVLLVFRYICLYDLYRSCDPGNAVMYLVLGIFFGILEPIFLLIVRKKDGGMPPRKETVVPEPVPIEESWEN